jgi:DNA-binding transcriptional regulator YiaG
VTSDTPQTVSGALTSPPEPPGSSVLLVRRALGWSQEQLAERLAVDRRTISRWEARETAPHAIYVTKMLDLLENQGGLADGI